MVLGNNELGVKSVRYRYSLLDQVCLLFHVCSKCIELCEQLFRSN